MAHLHIDDNDESVTHRLETGRTLIGRHPSCDVVLALPSVSGKHAIVESEGDNYFVEDIGSRNGTYVNRQRIERRIQLADRDEIQCGEAIVRFTSSDSPGSVFPFEPNGTGQVSIEDRDYAAATITSEVDSQGRFGVLDANPEAKLKAVLQISNALAGNVDLSAMLPLILDALFGIFKYADRGCILLKDEAGTMVPRAMKHRRGDQDDTVRLSRTIVQKVIDKKAGILSADAANDSAFNSSESIASLEIRSMMCVPLLGLDGEVMGVLSIDSQNLRGRFTQDDLEILVTVAGQAALSYETTRLIEAYAAKQKQDTELEIAKTVQRSLLPTDFPNIDGYEFFASYDSANAVGGDYYDCFELPEGKVVLAFGDVAGKGVSGALIMARMSSCVQSTIRHLHDVEPAMLAINDHMCDTSVQGRFVTFVLVLVDTQNHTLTLSNAGHMSPMIRRADGSVEQFDEEIIGTPIGVLEDYPYEAETRQLKPGDVVVIVTDGVDEAMNAAGDLYTGERCLEFVKNGPTKAAELGQALLADVRRHAGQYPQSDDITIMTFGRNPET